MRSVQRLGNHKTIYKQNNSNIKYTGNTGSLVQRLCEWGQEKPSFSRLLLLSSTFIGDYISGLYPSQIHIFPITIMIQHV